MESTFLFPKSRPSLFPPRPPRCGRSGKPRYSPAERAVWINDANHFIDVPQAVWDFTIGGYQVIDKYLKSRKARTLSLDEIENVENIINVLDFTIEQMGKIDAAYQTAFPSNRNKPFSYSTPFVAYPGGWSRNRVAPAIQPLRAEICSPTLARTRVRP